MRNKTATAARDTGRRAPEGQSVAPLLLSPSLVISHWHVASFCCSREYRTAGFLRVTASASGMGRGPQGRPPGYRMRRARPRPSGRGRPLWAWNGRRSGPGRPIPQAGPSRGPVPVRVRLGCRGGPGTPTRRGAVLRSTGRPLKFGRSSLRLGETPRWNPLNLKLKFEKGSEPRASLPQA